METVRCKICGRSAEGDSEFAIKAFQHREAQKAGRAKGALVYICPICAGRTRYEAEKEKGIGPKRG